MTGIDMYDTVLVEVGSLSTYNGAVPYIPNIAFITILIISIVVIFISILLKKVIFSLTIINSIYAILLLNFYKSEILKYLLFDIIFNKLIVFIIPVFQFIYLSYFTILLNLLFLGYFLFKKSKTAV